MKTYTVKITQKMCDKVLNSGTMKTRLTGTTEYINITESDCEENNYFPFEIKFCLVSESDSERYAQKNKGMYHSNNILRIPKGVDNFEIFENETSSDFYTLFEIKEKTEQYRFEMGSLYEYDEKSNSYIHCFKDAFVKTMKTAIKRYEEKMMMEPC